MPVMCGYVLSGREMILCFVLVCMRGLITSSDASIVRPTTAQNVSNRGANKSSFQPPILKCLLYFQTCCMRLPFDYSFMGYVSSLYMYM